MRSVARNRKPKPPRHLQRPNEVVQRDERDHDGRPEPGHDLPGQGAGEHVLLAAERADRPADGPAQAQDDDDEPQGDDQVEDAAQETVQGPRQPRRARGFEDKVAHDAQNQGPPQPAVQQRFRYLVADRQQPRLAPLADEEIQQRQDNEAQRQPQGEIAAYLCCEPGRIAEVEHGVGDGDEGAGGGEGPHEAVQGRNAGRHALRGMPPPPPNDDGAGDDAERDDEDEPERALQPEPAAVAVAQFQPQPAPQIGQALIGAGDVPQRPQRHPLPLADLVADTVDQLLGLARRRLRRRLQRLQLGDEVGARLGVLQRAHQGLDVGLNRGVARFGGRGRKFRQRCLRHRAERGRKQEEQEE